MGTISAVYDSGVLRPLDHVELPDQATVEFELRVVGPIDTTPDPDEAGTWLASVDRSWASHWDDPREDIYTLDDGEPLNSPG